MPRFRVAVLGMLRSGGLLRLVGRSGWRGRRLLILCYHGFSVGDEHLWNPNLYATGEHLERRLRRLREGGYSILPLGQALEQLYSRTLPPGAVVLTVDDGNHDFYSVAYPLFRRAGAPVTLYASTYYALDQRPIFDVACDYLLWRGRAMGRRNVKLEGLDDELDLGAEEGPAVGAARLRALATGQAWSADSKHHCLERLATTLGVDWAGFLRSRLFTLMTPDELAGLDPDIVDVQLHTHRHRMPDLRDGLMREVEDNRNALVRCGRAREGLVHFCYPSGVHAPHHIPWLREAGVVSATTCIPGLASIGSNPLKLPRFIDTYLTPDVEFDAWASGVRALLRRPDWLHA